MKKRMLAAAVLTAIAVPSVPLTGSAETVGVYEAEDAVMTGNMKAIEKSGCSGGKAAGNFAADTDSLKFTVEIPADGTYNIVINAKGYGGGKTNNIVIDGEFAGTFDSTADTYSDSLMRSVLLTAGTHEIAITKSWGWIAVDCIKIETAKAIPSSAFEVDDTLTDPHANADARVLFSYLCDRYGEQVLSGQFADRGLDSEEFRAIKEVTGKTPAILGLDMMDSTPSRVALGARSDAVERAIEFHNAGGIVTFCWHWNSPTAYLKEGTDENGSPRWWGGFYTRNTDFDISKVMDGSDPEGKARIDEDIAGIAQQLLRLQEAGVPVLWRPLHEASGGWFWWGARGAEPYKALYKYLYEQLTNVYGCHNLIWVWNGQSADWYPGDEYVDIIGEDIYVDKHSYTAHAAKFSEILDDSGGKKIIALTENGTIFDIDNVIATGAKWAWFTTWNGSFMTANGQFSEEYTEAEVLKKDYQSEYVITLDELPDWENLKNGTLRGDGNKDGSFNLADAVLLQKWLLAVPDTALPDWKAADLCEDGVLNVCDLCAMRQELTNG